MANEDIQRALTFRLLFDALGLSLDALEIDDLSGSIIFVNYAWCRLFERDRQSSLAARPRII